MIAVSIPRSRHERRNVFANLVCAAESFKQTAGQHDPEDGSALCRAFNKNLAAMILNDFLYDRQSQASAIFLAVADEGMKQALANGLSDAWAVVGDADGQGTVHFMGLDFHATSRAGR